MHTLLFILWVFVGYEFYMRTVSHSNEKTKNYTQKEKWDLMEEVPYTWKNQEKSTR